MRRIQDINNLESLVNNAIIAESKPLYPLAMVYGIKNDTIGFWHNHMLYAIPKTRKIEQILIENGFTKRNIYVPFAYKHSRVPTKSITKWELLKIEARAEYRKEFIEDANSFSNTKGLGEFDNKLIQNECFEMPTLGVEVILPRKNKKSLLYPKLIATKFNSSAKETIGLFATSDSTCVFVYRDGKTYVTRSSEIINKLEEKGYKKTNFTVPFTNGEQIVHPLYSNRWKEVTKATSTL